ncbi:hypothetical protein ERX46_12525 [Brumimicrobium glaciale]|jgi:hypothetical protein|uniref:Redoxin domain-containing protein n=1 Tax=Brumimicrobium glaciale TaxID=200475 RepID=A0A4V1WFE1_9FLAO|nr:hypothetical protein [Brumimicrobium glaciale]RYM32876.1 hypothetical protein ERX46_12525 [Brumimicrobium glaciale]
MIRIALSVITLAILIFFHNSIISFGLNIRLSFTFSKILPYMLEFFAVCLIIFNVYRQYLMGTSLTIRRLVSILILFGGSGIAFAVNPIYEGDFSHQYREISLAGENADTFQHGLTMIALPGCPFCFEKLEEMKRVKAIYPTLPMYVLVINDDELAAESYREASEGMIEVALFPESTLLRTIIQDGYPNLMYKPGENGSQLINWSNSGFGSASWDYILEEEGL